MMVTLVSQCEKKALKRSRRVLDAFANRIGSNTWQTVITQEGLKALHKQLRRTASKSTAISCHWIRSRSRTELVWIVGNATKFNDQGIVPVNYTRRNLLHFEWENNWHHGTTIQILATLAALLHDLGKATRGFQYKLISSNKAPLADPYRHEWISLRLFQALIRGCQSDEQWLARLSDIAGFIQAEPDWFEQMINDSSGNAKQGIHDQPPLAQLISWLIVTHHRLPFTHPKEDYYGNDFCAVQRRKLGANQTLSSFYHHLNPVVGWVKNTQALPHEVQPEDFWHLDTTSTGNTIINSVPWQRAMTRWTQKALNHPPLMGLAQHHSKVGVPIGDPFILMLARMSLMVGDHNYSSLPKEHKDCVPGDKQLTTLIANTEPGGGGKQALDEHLLGVSKFTAQFARLLPSIPEGLPGIMTAKTLSRRTHTPRFNWQNRVYELARSLQKDSQERGFFGVNMASTGCGKTLANARIMYGLASPKNGARFTIALGLRVLTLQTGSALQNRLQLGDDELAILVGGRATQSLFELGQDSHLGQQGSESLEELVDGFIANDPGFIDTDSLGTVVAEKKSRNLLYSPVVTCTVDHMISASECIRGGKHIAPILRLLSSDLILDEPDDFDQSDLPALSRLVHLAGLFGSKVLLSSATLTPDLVTGLFRAYQAGRERWNVHTGRANQGAKKIICAWFDESQQSDSRCLNGDDFFRAHCEFADQRQARLARLPVRRKAEVLKFELSPPKENQDWNRAELANLIVDNAVNLHHQHHETCITTQKTASVGLFRMANITALVQLAQALVEDTSAPSDTQIHICCYHARQLLMLRSLLENQLDRILTRTAASSLFAHPEIGARLNASSVKHHVFMVLATPVAEVGRDHDYDWAIVEPSSMRSIIQLAGRVWRHRPEKVADQTNILILNQNIKSLKHHFEGNEAKPVFLRPGFESDDQLLAAHRITDLIPNDYLRSVDSTSRIKMPAVLQPESQLADLEHQVMKDLLNPNNPLQLVPGYWWPKGAHRFTAELPLLSQFRRQDYREDTYVRLPLEENSPRDYLFKYADPKLNTAESSDQSYKFHPYTLPQNPGIKPWLVTDYDQAINWFMEATDEPDAEKIAHIYATASLNTDTKKWSFHPWLGFWS